jgi:hypothetical protein
LTLVTLEDKLLFILYDVKVSPLQEMLACEFGLVQRTANEWMHRLSEVVKKALDHGGYVPERAPKQLATVLDSEVASTYGRDGTERRRQRPCEAEKHKHDDSGKKTRTQSSIAFLAASLLATSILCVQPMKANVMIKRLLMKKTLHTPKTSVCRKIPAFKGMNRMG